MPRLRPYQPSDWQQLLSLELETAQDALGDTTEEERSTLRERWPRALSEQLKATPGAEVWVLEGEAGNYLGHIWLTDRKDSLGGARLLEVTTMGIVREARGQGFGRLLMQKAEAAAREKGIDLIELSVAGNNRRARDLYRDLGYDTTRRTMRKRMREPSV